LGLQIAATMVVRLIESPDWVEKWHTSCGNIRAMGLPDLSPCQTIKSGRMDDFLSVPSI
jgi:hypothetical protein